MGTNRRPRTSPTCFSTCPFSQPAPGVHAIVRSARVDARRLDQMVRAHLKEAPVVVPLLAGEDRVHRRLHVVVDAPTAGPAEEAEGALVRLKDHLLALAREDLNQPHRDVARA